jgi:predicted ribosome quality control (RQC) complex YloA/Tae2 family protein
LRFALPEQKHLVILDSGFRIHLTTFARETSPSPSSFVSKLRKHLKTRRLTGIRQIGDDRVLELSFSDGNYRLYLEFFAGGNVILTDREGLILAVLRIVNSEKYEYKVGGKYTVEEKPVMTEVKRDEVMEALESVAAHAAEAK